MKFKKGFLIMCLIICIISIASVSASEINETTTGNDDSGVIGDSASNLANSTQDTTVQDDGSTSSDETSVNEASAETEDDIDDGSFTALQKIIRNAKSGSTISLDKDYTYDEGFSKRGIVIAKNITINGNGHTLNGLSKSRIFLIEFGLVVNHKVVLNNIKFSNGNTDLYGGAIFNYANLTVNKCTFTNNYAKYCGGAINSIGHLTVKNSKFNKNVADGDGGAIFAFSINKEIDVYKDFYINKTPEGDMEFIFELIFNTSLEYGKDIIRNSTFTNNVAKGRGGGAVYGFTHLDIASSTFNSNKAGEHGGAVFANKNLILKSSKFTSNQAPKYGGAVYFRCHEQSGSYVNKKWVSKMKYYSASIQNSAFSKNTAKKGGAIYSFLNNASDKKRLKVNKCTFTANKATVSGRDVLGGTCSNCVFNYVKLTTKAVTVKKSAKKIVLTATLKKGNTALKAKKITFKFYGKTYTAKTNSKGVAKVNISKRVLKKLKAGKSYAVKITYLKKTVKTTVKVKK